MCCEEHRSIPCSCHSHHALIAAANRIDSSRPLRLGPSLLEWNTWLQVQFSKCGSSSMRSFRDILRRWKPVESPLATGCFISSPASPLCPSHSTPSRYDVAVDTLASTRQPESQSLLNGASFTLFDTLMYPRGGIMEHSHYIAASSPPLLLSTKQLHCRAYSNLFFPLVVPAGLTSYCVIDPLTALATSTSDLSYYGPFRAAPLTRSLCRT